MRQLQSMPEPLRSQMLNGDFEAGIEDSEWQVIPTEWVEAAQARWRPFDKKPPMDQMGVDVARGGKDNTTIATRHRNGESTLWFDEPHVYPGTETPSGQIAAGLVIGERRDHAPVMIDVIGVGASPYDILNGMGVQIMGVNVAESSISTDRSGRLRFFNLRSEMWWNMREALDPAADNGIALPPDKQLLAELCAPKWSAESMKIKVESREEIVKRIGRSPDRATAYILALIDVPKIHTLQLRTAREDVLNYTPFAREDLGYSPIG